MSTDAVWVARSSLMRNGTTQSHRQPIPMTHPHSTSSALRGHLLLPLIAASALVVLTPGLAVAQSERADCVAIVAEMLAPSPAPDAIRASAGCPVTGPVMLAQHWTRRGARGAEERAA